MVIHKYKLDRFEPIQFLNIPQGSKILSVKQQNNEPVIYILETDRKTKQDIRIRSYISGSSVPEYYGKFVGTVMLDGGNYVIHFFQEED